MSFNNHYPIRVSAGRLLDNLQLTNPFISDEISPQLESIQVDDDQNDLIFVNDNMSSVENDVNSVEE